ncbi:CbiX/SirB N-terminal domain-containing protein [Ovoidimarina sediminis]|uniref:CbiX/SirB N-terminal domain-containing protein n=1 Tax=Ovoidimarina sediminis TaxID=3079856 RepID=UPI002914C950|nr:CbiX/SirB N-terminal domain-containing protein [Rhodophyticola sp. MJ-SS7]MDU8941838.1 CbiX/SirB N-terminal domain-containing protein [Rhodophyticola sp. MJ-SS7]
MYITRSPFRPGRATEVLIVAHGSPSDPEPQERFVARLAERVGARTGAMVRGATLAKPGSLEAAVAGMRAPQVFPHFMTDGWFVSTHLQTRLETAGLADWVTLTPLGMSAALPELAARRLRAEMAEAELPESRTTLVVAAHGSPKDPRPARATEAFAKALKATRLFREVRAGYVDEAPSLEEVATVEGPAIVLPFFAARAGHVLMDLPEALEAAAFEGVVLPPIGTWDNVPLLICETLARAEAAP